MGSDSRLLYSTVNTCQSTRDYDTLVTATVTGSTPGSFKCFSTHADWECEKTNTAITAGKYTVDETI